MSSDLIEEQAERIAELEQELRTTSMEALAISDTNNELAAKVVELEKFRDMADGYGKLDADYAIAEARLSEAVKVLEPFANQADTFDSSGGEEFVPDEFMPAIVDHTIGDLRKARAFIATLGENKQ